MLSAEAAGTLSLDFTFDTNAFHGQYRNVVRPKELRTTKRLASLATMRLGDRLQAVTHREST